MNCECRHPKDFHEEGFDDCSLPDCECMEFRQAGSREIVNGLIANVPPFQTVSPASVIASDALIAKGKASDVKAIRALADKAEAAVAKLAERLSEDAASAAIRKEVADLEARLAAAKAKLRGEPMQAAPLSAKRNTAPRGEMRPCGAPGCDKQYDTGQGLALHRRRAHEGFNPKAGAA